ncbi:hypothetical protein IQ241_16220 [Romeria aff. gracilis LEGE 07310]|uniref:Uncharacterized protein n=1 Tax=Vasconcelosia minhoensis LEGE 07310 TaxID=915328 RepID=A0A8J7AGP0_9CYAN|nr:hypothetical protein [Romeria gracilis]MBE9078821.1 hypothetical protein [Romeria aff. gracilis LEGE 07310]
MARPSSTPPSSSSDSAELWQNLKSAIANSSGFRSWRSEQPADLLETTPLDPLVRLYLRETLETLAY